MSDTSGDLPLLLENSNPNYLISIFGTDELGNQIGTGNNPLLGILSPMPEEFSIETASSWHSILDGVLKTAIASIPFVGQNGAELVSRIAALSGNSLATVASSQLLWESTSPISFNIPLRFSAVRDADKDVTQPILKLLSLVLPSTRDTGNETADNNLPLLAPGPSFYTSYAVHIAIGNMFIFENIIVRSVSANFTTLSVTAGDFLYADVNVQIDTSRILTKKGLTAAFKNKGQFTQFSGSNTTPLDISTNSTGPNDI
jgi:hypothetical protein